MHNPAKPQAFPSSILNSFPSQFTKNEQTQSVDSQAEAWMRSYSLLSLALVKDLLDHFGGGVSRFGIDI